MWSGKGALSAWGELQGLEENHVLVSEGKAGDTGCRLRYSLGLQGTSKAVVGLGITRRGMGPIPYPEKGGELRAVPRLVHIISGFGVKPLLSFPESSLLPGLLGEDAPEHH